MIQDGTETIAAVATGTGGAVAIIRLSGPEAIIICDKIFRSHSGKALPGQKGFTIHYGDITDGERIVDDVLVSIFLAPKSYTGEDMAEISCHASSYIKSEIINLCIRNGARSATAGEFTMRAFLNGKMDLSQAEAVADIIASENKASHTIAMKQVRGGYSSEFNSLRDKLIELSSLLELELDFSEEDVEFADRGRLMEIINAVEVKIDRLLSSFGLGNIVRNGLPVAIAGSPNVGKSTLLNTLLNEDKAMVSEIAGTTRDTIEEIVNIDGMAFRFIDTAGIRVSDDRLENMGIERAHRTIEKASVVLLVTDPANDAKNILGQIDSIGIAEDQKLAVIINKADKTDNGLIKSLETDIKNSGITAITISAKEKTNIDGIITFLKSCVDTSSITNDNSTIVFNTRHHASLILAREATIRAKEAMENGIPGDLLSQDIHEIIHHISAITGNITNSDILSSIFSKFCIGK